MSCYCKRCQVILAGDEKDYVRVYPELGIMDVLCDDCMRKSIKERLNSTSANRAIYMPNDWTLVYTV